MMYAVGCVMVYHRHYVCRCTMKDVWWNTSIIFLTMEYVWRKVTYDHHVVILRNTQDVWWCMIIMTRDEGWCRMYDDVWSSCFVCLKQRWNMHDVWWRMTTPMFEYVTCRMFKDVRSSWSAIMYGVPRIIWHMTTIAMDYVIYRRFDGVRPPRRLTM